MSVMVYLSAAETCPYAPFKQTHISLFLSCSRFQEDTSVMAHEAVRSSTLLTNGRRALYANEALCSLIGCETGPVSVIQREEQGGGATSVRVPLSRTTFRGLGRARAETALD